MTIRKATQAETDQILRLTGKVMKESSMGYAPNSSKAAYNMFLPLIQSGAYYLVAEDNREIKGWILLGNDWNIMTNKPIGNLLDMYVLPKYRKAGWGRRLMEAAIGELYSKGLRTVQLNVFSGNPAKNMYERLGFKDISTVMELRL